MDLRRRLEEEQAAYKRKLTAYQEGQQRQAQLVQKLQAKVRLFRPPSPPRRSQSRFYLLQVLQYKKRCGDLEQVVQEKTSELDKRLLSVSPNLQGSAGAALIRGLDYFEISLRVSAKPPTGATRMSKAATWRTL